MNYKNFKIDYDNPIELFFDHFNEGWINIGAKIKLKGKTSIVFPATLEVRGTIKHYCLKAEGNNKYTGYLYNPSNIDDLGLIKVEGAIPVIKDD